MRFTVARRPIGCNVWSLGKRLRDVFRILCDSRLAHAHRDACAAAPSEFVTHSSVRRRAQLDDNQRRAQFAAHDGCDAETGPEETALDGKMLAMNSSCAAKRTRVCVRWGSRIEPGCTEGSR
jgi:hypothetical protein